MANQEAGGTEAFVHAQMAAQRAAAEDDGVDAERRQKFVESCTLKSHRYQAARSADAVTLERERIVQGAENAALSFSEMHSQLSEGVAFYTDLVGRLEQLVQTSEGYAYAQNMVRQDFETAQVLHLPPPPSSSVFLHRNLCSATTFQMSTSPRLVLTHEI